MNQVRKTSGKGRRNADRPNILVICMDQWQTHMKLPSEVRLPTLERLQARGVTLDRQYCTVPLCTPSRGSMWTGLHARVLGLWDNTNFAWVEDLSPEVLTIGRMLRDLGYYTAFKGKWHLSNLPKSEAALESFGFSDFQQWGDTFGPPLGGALYDDNIAFETADWIENKAPEMEQPWFLVCSLVNPHDIMFLQTDPVESPHPNGVMAGLQTTVQQMGWFEETWNIGLPENFNDDFAFQPEGVRAYKEFIDLNYGRIPENRTDLWLKRRNYLVNSMRLGDREAGKVLEALDRANLWENTIVVFTTDHGEMNGAHRMAQKGGIPFDEAAIVNLTFCVPGGPQGERSDAVGSHLDLAPTFLEFAGMSSQEIQEAYPQLKGRSLKSVLLDPNQVGPRGSARAPGDGALFCWDGLHELDTQWGITGALKSLTDLGGGAVGGPTDLKSVGAKYGAPDFGKRTFYRALVDGRYKIVRWFSPEEYGNPNSLDDLYAHSDVALYDLENDPGELKNIGHLKHPEYDPVMVDRMLKKLHNRVVEEIGEDFAPFHLDLFGTREVKYRHDPQGAREFGGFAGEQPHP